MAIIKDFIESAKDFILFAARANSDSRARMRDAVTKLSAELHRATSLVILYLEGAKGIDDDKELTAYLREARGKLLDTCNEFHVCGALYDLCDRFRQLFDPTRGSVSLGQGQSIQKFLFSLRDRERSVLDHIADTLSELEHRASILKPGDAEDRVSLRELLDSTIDELKTQQRSVTKAARKIVDTM
jgi:hypothetical protein